jgi:hypothetical protein
MMDAVPAEIGRATRTYLEDGPPRFASTDASGGGCETDELVASGLHDFLWPPGIGRQVAALVPGARFETWQMPDISPLGRGKNSLS